MYKRKHQNHPKIRLLLRGILFVSLMIAFHVKQEIKCEFSSYPNTDFAACMVSVGQNHNCIEQ